MDIVLKYNMDSYSYKKIPSGNLPQLVLELVKQNEGQLANPGIIELFQEQPEALLDVTKKLNDMGYRHFHLLGEGTFAVALTTADDRVIRIYAKTPDLLHHDRPKHPAILQPIESVTLPASGNERPFDVVIEVLPKVRTGEDVRAHHIIMLSNALKKSGMTVGDIELDGNVGLIDVEGRTLPVLVDPGRIKYDVQPAANDDHLKPWVEENGTWSQLKLAAYKKGLEAGKPASWASDETAATSMSEFIVNARQNSGHEFSK